MNFSFIAPTCVYFGRGMFSRLPEYCGDKKVFLLCDPFIASADSCRAIKQAPGMQVVGEWNRIRPNPECADAAKAAADAQASGAEVIVGIGGGSALDTAKIVAAAAGEHADPLTYLSGERTPASRLPLILVPTTSGTGSEVTNVSVLCGDDPVSGAHVKKPVVHGSLQADVALVDPALTDTMPPRVTAATGFDAICHAVEAFWSRAATPISDALAMPAVKLALAHIGPACSPEPPADSRDGMALASLMAGLAFAQTRTTVLHGNSFDLTERFGVEHGIACAILLPGFLRECAAADVRKPDTLARYCGLRHGLALADRLEELYASCGLPSRLSAYGVRKSDLEEIARRGLAQAITALTPVEVTEKMLADQLRRVL